MDKCKQEKGKLYNFACGCQQNYYTKMDATKESYFIKREESSYIREYGFETLPELKEELSRMWDEDPVMQECMKVVLVSAMKLKPQEEEEEQQTEEYKNEKLPAFIYNF